MNPNKLNIILSIGTMVSMLFCSCAPKLEEIESQATLLPAQVTHNGTILYSKNGKQALRLESGIMENYIKDTSLIKVKKGLKAWFFDSTGVETSYLEGDSANFFEEKGQLDTFGDVMLGNESGDTLYTNLLIWYRDSQKVYAPGKVKIETPDGVVYGIGLKANEDFSAYILKEVSGEFEIKDSIE